MLENLIKYNKFSTRKCMNLMRFAFALLLLARVDGAFSAEIHLNLPSLQNNNHSYYFRLLEESLKAVGHTVKITSVDNLPQPRIVSNLDDGKLTLFWLLQSKERDEKYIPVDNKVTQGLIGQRIMLIPRGDEELYKNVRSIEDFRALGKVAGLGKGWYDAAVWSINGLPYVEQAGDWKNLYSMVAQRNRGIDYFPRGVTEIDAEAKNVPLAVEPHLLLVYPTDFRFYLSRPNAHLKPIIEDALAAAKKSGLQSRLIEEHFGPAVARLNVNKRLKISLKIPTVEDLN